MRKDGARWWVPLLAGATALCGTAAAALAMRAPLDHIAFDGLQRLWPRPYQAVPVRVVAIDADSLARLGPWPWPRDRMTALITTLRQAGAGAIALDLVMNEPDPVSPPRLVEAWRMPPEWRNAVADLPDTDETLAEAIGGGSVVVAFAAGGPVPTAGGDPADIEPKAKFLPPVALAALPDLGGTTRTLAAMEVRADGNGAIFLPPDADGVLRLVPLLGRLGGHTHPSLALEATRVATGGHNVLIRVGPTAGAGGGIEGVALARLEIPLDASGALRPHYTRPAAERLVPAWQVLDGSAPVQSLADHIVFVGLTAPGLAETRVTALGDTVPRAVIHAEVVEGALLGKLARRATWMDGAEAIAAAGAGMVALLGAAFMPAAGAIALALAVVTGLGTASAMAFLHLGMLSNPLIPALAALAALAVAAPLRQRQQARRGALLRQALARHLPPSAMRTLVEKPRMAADTRRECSVVVARLAGLAELAERADPPVALSVLAEFRDGLAAIAFIYRGTLDHMEGDRVVVVFSAPLEQRDHAVRAVACALEMDRFGQDFTRAKAREGIRIDGVRVGIDTGVAVFGTINAAGFADLSIIGGARDGAARMAEVTNMLGIRICASSRTANGQANFIGRPVGRLPDPVEKTALEAFEPLPVERLGSAVISAYLSGYALLSAGDVAAARGAFATVAAADPLTAFHLDRLERGERGITIGGEAPTVTERPPRSSSPKRSLRSLLRARSPV